MLIEYPDLELRNEDRLAAEAIARISGGLTSEIVGSQIRARQELLKLIEAGLDAPICPELTNANPASPHTVLLEAIAWTLSQQAYRINKIPQQNHIAFANLFGIERKAATPAETPLTFAVDAPANTAITIPEGTQISDLQGNYVFETVEDLIIPYGDETGIVTAKRTIAGHTLLISNVLTEMIDSVAFVESVTNENAVDSGTELESLESVLNRLKRYQKRGERIVSAKDLEEAIRDEALNGNGVVRVFPFIVNGEFQKNKPTAGHTTVIVMTATGENIDSLTTAKIAALLDQAIGNQFIYIVDPFFVEFSVEVNVKLGTGTPQGTVLKAIEKNLRNFYSPSREQFGRAIYRSEIIAVIEGTAGVDRIEVAGANQILIAPTADTKLKEFELPKLVNITINVV